MTERDKHPWLAAGLALAYPGLGHLYLRKWGRGLMWFALIISIPVFLIPPGVVPTEFSVDAFLAASRAMPVYVPVLVLVTTGLSVFDAYRMAIDHNQETAARERGETLYCPSCGKTLSDPNLDFCQWCAEPLDTAEKDG